MLSVAKTDMMRCETRCAAARQRHRRHELDVADVLHLLAAVVQKLVRPQLEEPSGLNQRRLLRHVEVVAQHHHPPRPGANVPLLRFSSLPSMTSYSELLEVCAEKFIRAA